MKSRHHYLSRYVFLCGMGIAILPSTGHAAAAVQSRELFSYPAANGSFYDYMADGNSGKFVIRAPRARNNCTDCAFPADIHLFDSATDTDKIIGSFKYPKMFPMQPMIFGDKVAFATDSCDLMVKTISTQVEDCVIPSLRVGDEYHDYYPTTPVSMDNDGIYLQCTPNSQPFCDRYGLYFFDFKTRKLTYKYGFPSDDPPWAVGAWNISNISNKKMLWHSDDGHNAWVVVYLFVTDLLTGQRKTIDSAGIGSPQSAYGGSWSQPYIQDGKILYTNGFDDVVLYDLATSSKRVLPLTRQVAGQKFSEPKISGDLVVVVASGLNGSIFKSSLRGFDLKNGEEFKIADLAVVSDISDRIKLSGDTLIWEDNSKSADQITVHRSKIKLASVVIPPPPPPVVPPTPPTPPPPTPPQPPVVPPSPTLPPVNPPTGTLAAPSGLTATWISGARVTLKWNDNSSAERGFQIEENTNGMRFTLIKTVGANLVTFDDQNNNATGSTHQWRVRAYTIVNNKFVYSAYSNVAVAKIGK